MPGTVLLMQNVDLGHTKVIKIRQRETLSYQGAMIHENYCSAAKFLVQPSKIHTELYINKFIGRLLTKELCVQLPLKLKKHLVMGRKDSTNKNPG